MSTIRVGGTSLGTLPADVEVALAAAQDAYNAAQTALSAAQSAAAAAGIVASNLTAHENLTSTAHGGIIPEAPSDGSQYARKDGAWEEVAGGASCLTSTRNEILATTPDALTFAKPSDTEQIMMFVPSLGWFENAAATVARAGTYIGAFDGNIDGIGPDYLHARKLVDCWLSGNGSEREGTLRHVLMSNGAHSPQVHRDGSWLNFLLGQTQFTVRIDTSPSGINVVFSDLGYQIDLYTGNSHELDLAGLPLIRGGVTPIGCYSSPRYIDGGTF